MTGTSLTQFLADEQRNASTSNPDLLALLSQVATACKSISNAINQGALAGVMGSLDSENVQGETQKKLDVITNEIFIETSERSGQVAGISRFPEVR